MKDMRDRRMDMNQNDIDSDDYFPSQARHKKLERPGQIGVPKYPDTEELIARDQNDFVKNANDSKLKSGFRH